MKTIKVKSTNEIPENYTGLVEFLLSADKYWFVDGELHREDGPAIEDSKGVQKWFSHGKLHREDGPAIEHPWGDKIWYLNGVRHREDGPAIEYPSGDKYWFSNGLLHREDGPAISLPGDEAWFLNGKELDKNKIEFLINLGYPIKTAIKLSSIIK